MRRSLLALAPVLVLTAACGGGPPDSLGGFELGASQREVMDLAGAHGGFACRLRATYPRETVCEGPVDEGVVTVMVRGDSVVRVELRLEPGPAEVPGREVARFVRPFGDPAWRDRPQPPRAQSPESYHTLWVDGDSARALSMACAGRGLEPPCTAELVETSPRRVMAKLDTLLGIRR